MGFSARSASLVGVLALVLAPAAASAQPGPAPAPPPAGGGAPAAPAPAAGGGAAPAPAGSGGAAAEKPASSSNLGGFTFSDKPQKRAASSRGVIRHASGPIATLPGFEQTGDGGSRFFVQLTQQVPVEERKAQGSITYVLKGAHVNKRNNTNALVTVHFNTPVSRARLVPQGNDLLFILDLRAAVTPTFKMQDAPDKTAMLTVDFPKGDFVAPPPAGDTPPVAGEQGDQGDQGGDENTEKAPKPPPAKKSGKKRGGAPAPPPGPKP